jgi:hypothetical protein
MRAATNRQTERRALIGGALEAAVVEIAFRDPDLVVWDPPLTLPEAAAIMARRRDRGRTLAYAPSEWPARRVAAVSALGGNPTQAQLAGRLGISVRTLRNYDRLPRLS